MESELKSLRIDRSQRAPRSSDWAARWIVGGICVFLALGVARFAYSKLNAATEVEAVRVSASPSGAASTGDVILNATGYIVAHHKIEVAAKVIGRVAWIGVEKGDHVKQGQVIVRLEDDEYRAQVQQAKGSLANLEARLSELKNGSRPEEIEVTTANLEQAKADLVNYKVTLERTKQLVAAKVSPTQALDDAQAKYDGQVARVNSLIKTDKLSRLGPRSEQVTAMAGQVEQARGALAYAETQLADTVIHAPVTGTILERAVEKGEFVTTSFVGDKGAKGYVVSLADLNDLQVELDIAQNDFAKLSPRQRAIINTDAYPDRKYQGVIFEVSPEANRQKATVQIKVKVLNPDDYLRPEMNASVAFLSDAKPAAMDAQSTSRVLVPAAAVKNGSVFVVLNGKALARAVKTGITSSAGMVVEQGLVGGEDVILNPPVELKSGDRVHVKGHDMTSEVVIETSHLSKEFIRDEFHVVALKDVGIEIHKGEFVALMGPSGSGKSTLLHLIAAMDTATGGEIAVLGQNLRKMSDKQIAHWRNENVGFIFQSFNLIPVLTAIENVELPLKLTNLSKKERLEHAQTALKLVGLGDRLTHFPRQLSGGQEQRVAIARAIVTDPALILADEPTGNLDAASAEEVLTMLQRLNREFGKTIVMVTHDPHAAKFASKARHLEKGELLAESAAPAF